MRFQTVCIGLTLIAGCGTGETNLPLMRIEEPAAATLTAINELTVAGDVNAALARANQEIERHPQSAGAYEARANAFHKQRAWDQALADFNRAIELDPASARLRNNRGFLYLTLERYDASLADFAAAIERSPEFHQAYNNRALVQIAQGKFRQAIEDLDRALVLQPDYLDAANNRGFSHMNLRRWDRALGDFNRVLALDSKHVNALANRALVKQQLGDFAGSITDLTAAMLLDPDQPKYYAHRRDAYLAQGDADRARQDEVKIQRLLEFDQLTAAIAAQPDRASVYLARAKAFESRGDEPRALADLSKAIEIAPQDSAARLQRARLSLNARNFRAALADCEAVLTQGPNELAFSIRGDCRLALDQLDDALADFEQARRLDTAVADAYYRKGNDFARRGDSEQAKAYHDKAVAIDPEVGTRR